MDSYNPEELSRGSSQPQDQQVEIIEKEQSIVQSENLVGNLVGNLVYF